MDKFCKECGKPVTDELQFCQNCGYSLKKECIQSENHATVHPKKRSKVNSKKKKFYMAGAALIAVIIAAFFMWGNAHYSAETATERFITALVERDRDVIQELTLMNGETISDVEADGLIRLAKEESSAVHLQSRSPEEFLSNNDLFELVENENSFFIFTNYAFSLVPQYAGFQLPFEDIETTFNDVEFPVTDASEGEIIYGPFAPGKYNTHNRFSGEFMETESEDTIVLANRLAEITYNTIELEADYVKLTVTNLNDSPINKAFIEVNDQMIPFNNGLQMEGLGPLNLDGSVTITPVIETEWGEVKLDSIDVESSFYEIPFYTISDDLETDLSEVVLQYGEEYLQAYAAYDTGIFTTNTTNFTETFREEFETNATYEMLFTGQLDKVEVDYDALIFNEKDKITLPTNYYFSSVYYFAGNDIQLEDRLDRVRLVLMFDSDEEKWLIDSASPRSFYSGFEDPLTLKGSQELYPSASTVSAPAAASDEDIDALIKETTLNYIYELVEAINASDYDLVRPYIKDDSALHDMQVDLVDRLSEDGMTQEVISASVTSIEETDGRWHVVTEETIKKIYASGEEETNDYVWNYTVEKDGVGVALANIE